MKLAHFSDLHLTSGPRLADQRATLAAMVDDILATEPDLVLCGGDLYGRTVPWKSTPEERAVLFPELVRLADVAPVIVIQGNHDLAAEIEELAHLGGRWPIRVVTGAAMLEVRTAAGLAHVYALAYPTKRNLLAGEETPEGGAVGTQRAVEEALTGLLGAWGHRVRRRRASHPDEVHVGLMHLQVAGCVTSGGEVLAGGEVELSRHTLDGVGLDYVALGHLHKRQEVASRAWYSGSPWRNDFSEREPKGWHEIEIVPGAVGVTSIDDPDEHPYDVGYASGDRLACYVTHRPTACRTFTTLDYTWSDAGWSTRPTAEQLTEAAGAEVRMRLTVSEAHVAGCPWAAEVERVTAIAHRVVEERTIEPVHRVRAPEVAAAVSDREKLGAYWSSLAEPPTEADQAAAIEAMATLDAHDDETIAGELRGMVF